MNERLFPKQLNFSDNCLSVVTACLTVKQNIRHLLKALLNNRTTCFWDRFSTFSFCLNMKSKIYNVLLVKLLVYLGRVFGVFFGGVVLPKNQKNQLNLDVLSKNKPLQRLSFLAIIYAIAFSVYNIYCEAQILKTYSFNVVSDVIYLYVGLAYRIGHVAIVVITHRFGSLILGYLMQFPLRKHQFFICLAMFVVGLIIVVVSGFLLLFDFLLKSARFSTIAFWQSMYYFISLPHLIGNSLELFVSYMAYLRLCELKQFLTDPIPSKNIGQKLKVFSQQFLDLKVQFLQIAEVLEWFYLISFSVLISYFLSTIHALSTFRGYSFSQTTQLAFLALNLYFRCKIHGLPHKATADLLLTFDRFVAQIPFNVQLIQSNLILSRDTIGLRLLGCKYDESLLSSALVFVLSYSVLIIQTTQNNSVADCNNNTNITN